jgi:hypothetical protein
MFILSPFHGGQTVLTVPILAERTACMVIEPTCFEEMPNEKEMIRETGLEATKLPIVNGPASRLHQANIPRSKQRYYPAIIPPPAAQARLLFR